MKFYEINSVNPLILGTPSNDDALDSLLVWDSSTGLVKYRNASSISGGGSGSVGTLEQTLIQGNDAGTYSIQFRGGESEIYSIDAGTAFYGFYENQPSILAITSSAFAFYPKISQNISGLSILSSIIGGVAWNDIGVSGLSQQAWMKTQNANVDGFASICLRNSQICIESCNTTTPYPYLSHMDMTVSGVIIESCDNTGQRTISTNQQSVDLFASDGINSNSIILKGSSVCLNGSAGGDGQVVSINSSGQLCWSTAGGGGGGSGSTILNACEVGFGTGTGITSSSVFTFDNTYKNFKVGESSSIDSTSCNSVIVGGSCNTLQCNSRFSSILGGGCNTLNYYSYDSSIIGGGCNTITTQTRQSSILGGGCNTLQCGSKYSSIVGGQCNTLQCGSCYSSIVGGSCNILEYNSCNSVILGGSNLSLCNECNIVYVPELKVSTASNDNALTKVLVWDEGTSNKMKWRDSSTIGASDPDFLYINTAFVHPDGNDGTAVIGDFSLPFATITAALTALKSGPSPDPVIEIWPRDSVRGPAPTYLPSTSYDYILNTNLVIDINIKIHLKAGVRIRYTGDYGVDTPLFYVSNDKADILLTVTAEDSSSTIEVINGNGYEHLITILDGSQAVFENVTIYSESKQSSNPPVKVATTGFATIIGVGSKMVIRNCLFYNNPPVTDYSGNVYMLQESVFESWNSRLINIQPADASSTHIYQDSIGGLVTGYSVVRLHDTVAVQRNTFGRSGLSNLIDVNQDAKCYLMMGNSTFWFSDSPSEKIGGNAGVHPLTNNTSLDAYVQYTSRSIHNYEPTTYLGSWIEVSGSADSSTALGAYGFGQFQYYTSMYEPFDTV